MTNNLSTESTNYRTSSSEKNGATITSVYVGRKVKVYAVHEPELNNLSLLNTFSIIMFSAASFVLSIAARNGLENIFKDGTTLISILLYILGGVGLIFKRNILKKIKEESSIDSDR